MNNFAQLADGENAAFLVRWRGRQEGPLAAAAIEAAGGQALIDKMPFEGVYALRVESLRDLLELENRCHPPRCGRESPGQSPSTPPKTEMSGNTVSTGLPPLTTASGNPPTPGVCRW